jgi:hypothetical protein
MIDFHELARDVDAAGMDSRQGTLQTLGDLARRASVSSVLIQVMLDPNQPEVARVRALARVQGEMGHRRGMLAA